MAQSTEPKTQVEKLVLRAEQDLLDASRQLADGVNREAQRFVPPVTSDVGRLMDSVFDFAEQVIKGQRQMVHDVLQNINEQTKRPVGSGRRAPLRAANRGPTKTAAKKPTANKTTTRKAAASRAPARP